jgi:hypothetical protein
METIRHLPGGAVSRFPAAGLAAKPGEAGTKLWDDLWAARESARLGRYSRGLVNSAKPLLSVASGNR